MIFFGFVDVVWSSIASFSSLPPDRWMDKSFQLIVCQNGQTAVNFEHAWGDGIAVLRFFNDTFKETTKNPWVPLSSTPGPLPERLEFRLTDPVKVDQLFM